VRGRGMCLSGKLVPHRLPHSTTPAREITERETPAFGSRCANPHTGVYPRYRAGQGPLPRPSTAVEAPRYPPDDTHGARSGVPHTPHLTRPHE
jgi:hypothetical protein